MLVKLKRYPHRIPRVCPFCLVNPSLGMTDWGILGCQFCQKEVDDYIQANYKVAGRGGKRDD